MEDRERPIDIEKYKINQKKEKNMKKKILSLVIALALIVALVPAAAVFAADVTGSVTSNNNAPEALSLTIDGMVPNVADTLTITVTDDNTL